MISRGGGASTSYTAAIRNAFEVGPAPASTQRALVHETIWLIKNWFSPFLLLRQCAATNAIRLTIALRPDATISQHQTLKKFGF